MTTLVDEIKAGYERGWSFTPLRGKAPYLDAWQRQPRPSLDDVLGWANQGNVGLRTGPTSGIAVIDIDTGSNATRDCFPRTWTAWTGGGGFHLYYRCTLPVRNVNGKSKPMVVNPTTGELCNVDVRGEGGQVVFIGSVHPETQKQYHWMQFAGPRDVVLSEFPYYLLEGTPELKPEPSPPPQPQQQAPRQQSAGSSESYGLTSLANCCDAIAQATEGGRHHTMIRMIPDIGSLVGVGWLDYDTAHDALCEAGRRCGLPEHQVQRNVTDQLKFGAAKPSDHILKKVAERQQPTARPALVEPVGVDAF